MSFINIGNFFRKVPGRLSCMPINIVSSKVTDKYSCMTLQKVSGGVESMITRKVPARSLANSPTSCLS